MDDLQQLCEEGQRRLIETDYWGAERALERAEAIALGRQDYDSLGRLYMPLQEARRQRRQRAGEGMVRMDVFARSGVEELLAEDIAEEDPHGQLLVAGWGTAEPARALRAIARERGLFLDVLAGATYHVGEVLMVALLPLPEVTLPPGGVYEIDQLLRLLPPHALLRQASELPSGERPGTPETYAQVMALWEQLQAPYLAAADATTDLARRIEAYRTTIAVDYAAEFAHQRLSNTARELHHERLRDAAAPPN